MFDDLVKSQKINRIRRLRKKLRRQGAQSMRSEAHFWAYAATTKDAAQRSIRAFYAAVKFSFTVIRRFIIRKGRKGALLWILK
jgi:hypothetical protein